MYVIYIKRKKKLYKMTKYTITINKERFKGKKQTFMCITKQQKSGKVMSEFPVASEIKFVVLPKYT